MISEQVQECAKERKDEERCTEMIRKERRGWKNG